jgi:hypothetical protein
MRGKVKRFSDVADGRGAQGAGRNIVTPLRPIQKSFVADLVDEGRDR